MAQTLQKALVVGALGLAGLAAIGVLRGSHADADAKNPRAILGRVWLDKYPKDPRDAFDLWIFLGGGIGIEEKGSRFRFGLDVFELERQGDKMEIAFLHDKKKETHTFTIAECDDKPPFDLCVDFDPPLRGVKRYYSWSYDDDMDARLPWGREVRAAAEARAKSMR